jgi:HEAT repeat protein
MQKLDNLIDELLSGDENRAERSARSFPTYGAAGLHALSALVSQQDPDTRWWAARALAAFDQVEHPQAADFLIKALQDPDASVQACAAVGLREKPSFAAIPALIQLLSHTDKLLARVAADALIALQKSATPALVDLVEKSTDDHNNAKVEAVRALALIGDPTSISTLFKVWENGSSMVQHWAEKGLNDMGIGMAFFDPGG